MGWHYCFVCKKDCRCEYFHTGGGGDFVRFRDYRPTPEGVVGPAQGLGWFCTEHLAAAQRLSPQTLEAAQTELRRTYGDFPNPSPSPMPDPSLWVTSVGPNFAKVFGVVRQMMEISPSRAKLLLSGPAFRVATGWPSQFEHWRDALRAAGAVVEVRYE